MKYICNVIIANTSIKALVQLIDDPDDNIYEHVRDQLKQYGNEAIPYLEKAITKKDTTNIPFHILAKCYEIKNDPVKATSIIESCLKKFPNDAKAKAELNKLYTKIKD